MKTLLIDYNIMQDNIIISANYLTKEYNISDGLFSNKNKSTITALNGVNLEVKSGEIIGIIGRNGSGKSTLLKILSQITKPTAGNAVIKGKVVSAIEVSGGFNMDLSGKENIKLIGQIWGLSLKKIKELENTIIEFANLSNFIFLPVKKLSTGMIGRLAASIIIHIDADIYIFDETLNGSDQLFTRKIHKKLIELQNNNKSVLISSHKITDLLTLCTKGMVLEAGKIVQIGNPFESIITYQKILRTNVTHIKDSTKNRLKNNYINFNSITINKNEENYNISITLSPIVEVISELNVIIIINNSFDSPIGNSSFVLNNISEQTTISCKIPCKIFSNGIYIISLALMINSEDWLFLPKAIEFETTNNSSIKYQFIPGISITEAKWDINN